MRELIWDHMEGAAGVSCVFVLLTSSPRTMWWVGLAFPFELSSPGAIWRGRPAPDLRGATCDLSWAHAEHVVDIYIQGGYFDLFWGHMVDEAGIPMYLTLRNELTWGHVEGGVGRDGGGGSGGGGRERVEAAKDDSDHL